MDAIFQFGINHLQQLLLGTVTTFAGGFLALRVWKTIVEKMGDIAVDLITSELLQLLKTPEDRRLALEVVKWVEKKIGKKPGYLKQSVARAAIQARIPYLSKSDVDRAINILCDGINRTEKLVTQKIREAGIPE